ncbi:septal ring lytic transglycosylase RlpA family protein [Methylobacterium sp. A54F]
MLLQRFALRAALACFTLASAPACAASFSGTVSHYGYESGKLTANGEDFDPQGPTCAHWTLPFNTVLRVTDRATGRSVECRVNDRGPHPRLHRTLDLTDGKARELGMGRRGLIRAEITVVKLGDGATHHRRHRHRRG